MADDIVTRLHFAADEHLYRICKPDSPDTHGAHGDICHEQVMTAAADEIERLRAAGDELAEHLSNWAYSTEHALSDHRALETWEEARRG